MKIPVRAIFSGWGAFLLLAILLVLSVWMLVDGYRKGNQRLVVEIQEALGATGLAHYVAQRYEERDPSTFRLLNRKPLINYCRSHPRTLTPQQEIEGVPLQVFIDRYSEIWTLTQQPQARRAAIDIDLHPGTDHLLSMQSEFEGMNSLLIPIPTRNSPLSLQERVKWATRSLECIEGYLGGGFLLDEMTRMALLVDWINKSRWLMSEIESADQLRSMLAALDSIEPPVTAIQRALEMEYIHSIELLQAQGNSPQEGLAPFYRQPELHFGLTHLLGRITHIDQPVESIDPPWYVKVMPDRGVLDSFSIRGPFGFPPYFWGEGVEFIQHAQMLSQELAAGIDFFEKAVRHRIARLEEGQEATLAEGLVVKAGRPGEILVIGSRLAEERSMLPDLFEPYRFPE